MSARERWVKRFDTTNGFLGGWFLTIFVLASVAYPAAVALCYNNLGNQNGDWIHHLFLRKEAALRLAGEGPRILTVGGSGCLFSVNAEVLARELHQPVINLCSHAGLGLEYMLSRVRRHAREGDTVILIPEYRVLINPDPRQTRIEWDYFTTWDRWHYVEHGLGGAYKLLYGIPFADLQRSVQNWRQFHTGYVEKLDQIYDVSLMTRNGDLQESLGRQAVLHGSLDNTFLAPAAYSRELIGEFKLWAATRGIQVRAAYQPVPLDPADYWRAKNLFGLLPGWWRSIGIEPIGSPERSIWPSAGFMDTLQHAGPGVSYAYAVHLARTLRGEGAALERLLVPPHPPQVLLPLPGKPGAAVYPYFGSRDEDVEIGDFRRAGGRVYVATSALAGSLRARGFVVRVVNEKRATPADVLDSNRDAVIAICVRTGAPPVSGLPAFPGGRAWTGLWRQGQWITPDPQDAAAGLQSEFKLPLATGELIQYRFRLRVVNGACELNFQGRDRSPSPAAVVRMLVLDPGRGILRSVYNFDSDLRTELSWLGEIAAP